MKNFSLVPFSGSLFSDTVVTVSPVNAARSRSEWILAVSVENVDAVYFGLRSVGIIPAGQQHSAGKFLTFWLFYYGDGNRLIYHYCQPGTANAESSMSVSEDFKALETLDYFQ